MAAVHERIKEQLGDTLQESQICDYVRFTVADFNGVARSKLVTRRHLAEFFNAGVKVPQDILSIGCDGYFPDANSSQLQNAALLPVAGTLRHITWAGDDYRIGEVLCEMCHFPSLVPMETCPRVIARRQLDRLDELGFRFVSSFEPQFVLTRDDKPLYSYTNYLSSFELFQQEPFVCELVSKLFSCGVDAETISNEFAPSQFRVYLREVTGLRAADMNFVMKKTIKEIANTAKMAANFMTVPFPPKDGQVQASGLFLNHSIVDHSGYNVLKPEDKESEVFQHWLAGLITHSRGLMALFCPTVNCYRMNYPDFNWAVEDRRVAYRVKLSKTNEAHIECTVPGSAANPYLVLAGLVAAGIDGLKKSLTLPPQRDPSASEPPRTFNDALDALQQDQVLVDALGKEFVDLFAKAKRNTDLTQLADSKVGDVNDEAGFAREYSIYSYL